MSGVRGSVRVDLVVSIAVVSCDEDSVVVSDYFKGGVLSENS